MAQLADVHPASVRVPVAHWRQPLDDWRVAKNSDSPGGTAPAQPVGEVRLLNCRPAKGLVSLREYGNGDCVFLDPQSRRCTIYPVRPRQCRTWPFWRSNIESAAAWEKTCQTCPGAGQGPLVTVEQIEVLAAEIEL